MSLLQKIRKTKYRMTMRIALQKSSIEELLIAREELIKEIERRNRQK